MKFAALFLLGLLPLGEAGAADYFVPEHRIAGIGVARDGITPDLLQARTDLMIQSQTFSIMRDPQAVPGARRITSDRRLQDLFRSASQSSGIPATLIEAIAYLESWGQPRAESPTGPKGIMQISAATARTMGLKIVQAKRYKVTRERVLIPAKKGHKARYKTVTHRTPYMVTVRDDRLTPARAIPAAANYLAGMVQKFGGLDWAIFAYHCGQGCVNEMMDLTRRTGLPPSQVTVPRMFFSSNPAWNRNLYEAIQQQMERDFSPTYYFRVRRAEQLLALYRTDPVEFTTLSADYRSDFTTGMERAPHRLSVWLRRGDMVFHTCDDIKADQGKRLVKALNRPEYYGYTLRVSPDSPADLAYFEQASPAALGALTYVAFETRRLLEALNDSSVKFRPLEITALVEPQNMMKPGDREAEAHCSGQVFDIDYGTLPSREVECLRFVLADLGWNGYLGFVEDGHATLHVGCSPTSRDFFATVFQEATGKPSLSSSPVPSQ